MTCSPGISISEGGELGLNSKGGKKMVGLSTGDEGGSLMMLTEKQKLQYPAAQIHSTPLHIHLVTGVHMLPKRFRSW